jgi:serine/threonine-protein kinase
MSPEQLRSTATVDLRTDIWSIGSVLFETLTGATPFCTKMTLHQLVAQVAFEPPRDLAKLRPGIDPDLASVVMRCLEKDPEARWPNTAELACALLPWAPKRAYPVAERALAMVAGSKLPSSGNVKMPSYRPGPHVPFTETPTMRFVPDEEHRSTASNLVRARGESVAPPKREVSAAFIATVAAAAAALGLVAFVSVRPGPLPAHAAASPAGTVDIVLRAEPRDAHFSIDDGPPLENPWVGHAPRDGKSHVIHARAPGHQEKTREVTFDRDLTLGILLTKEPKR